MAEEKSTKSIWFSKQFWGTVGATLGLATVNWPDVVQLIENVVAGSVPPDYVPIVHAVAALILAILAALGMGDRLKGKQKVIK